MVSVWCVQIPCCLPRFFLCVGRVEGMIPSRKGHSEALDFSISGWSRPKCCGLCCALCPSSTGAWPLKMGESWQLKTIGCFEILKKCHSNGWFATESWSHLHVVLLFVAFWVKPPIQSSRTVGVICPSHPVRCENRAPQNLWSVSWNICAILPMMIPIDMYIYQEHKSWLMAPIFVSSPYSQHVGSHGAEPCTKPSGIKGCPALRCLLPLWLGFLVQQLGRIVERSGTGKYRVSNCFFWYRTLYIYI